MDMNRIEIATFSTKWDIKICQYWASPPTLLYNHVTKIVPKNVMIPHVKATTYISDMKLRLCLNSVNIYLLPFFGWWLTHKQVTESSLSKSLQLHVPQYMTGKRNTYLSTCDSDTGSRSWVSESLSTSWDSCSSSAGLGRQILLLSVLSNDSRNVRIGCNAAYTSSSLLIEELNRGQLLITMSVILSSSPHLPPTDSNTG